MSAGAPEPDRLEPAVDLLARRARGLSAEEVLHLCCAEAAPPRVAPPARLVQLPGCLAELPEHRLAELVAAAPGLVMHLEGCSAEHPAGGPSAAGPAAASSAAAGPVEHLRQILGDLGLGHRLAVHQHDRTRGLRDRQHDRTSDAHDRQHDPTRDLPPPRHDGSAVGVEDLPVSRRQLFSWMRPPSARPDARRAAPGGVRIAAGASLPEHDTPPGGRQRRSPWEDEGAGEHGEAQPQVLLAGALRELVRQEGRVAQTSSGGAPQFPSGGAPSSASRRDPHTSSGDLTRATPLTARGCTACGTCVKACPTAALSLTGLETGQATLRMQTAACVGCDRCLALCPVDALRSGPRLDWSALAGTERHSVLERVRVQPCDRCRTPFSGEGNLCQVCALRQQNPFGSWLPPGYVAPKVYAPPPEQSSGDGGQRPMADE